MIGKQGYQEDNQLNIDKFSLDGAHLQRCVESPDGYRFPI